jgi:hypothetical protein
MVLLGASCLALTQVSVDGSFGGLFPGLLIFGLGMGAAFVAGSIASLAGVAEQHSGQPRACRPPPSTSAPRSGVAILSTVAVARTNDVLAAAGQQARRRSR